MGAAPRERQGIASGVLATSRNMGMVLGVGYAGAIFTTKLGYWAIKARTVLFWLTQASFLAATLLAVLGIITTLLRTQPVHSHQPSQLE